MSDHGSVLKHPGVFAVQTLKAFRANQGLLLAGAVAYYALLSIVPLLSGRMHRVGPVREIDSAI